MIAIILWFKMPKGGLYTALENNECQGAKYNFNSSAAGNVRERQH